MGWKSDRFKSGRFNIAAYGITPESCIDSPRYCRSDLTKDGNRAPVSFSLFFFCSLSFKIYHFVKPSRRE